MSRLAITVFIVLSFVSSPFGSVLITDAQAKTKQEMIDNADKHDDELDRETAEPADDTPKPVDNKKAVQAEATVEQPKAIAQEEKSEKPSPAMPEKKANLAPSPVSEPKPAPEKKDWWKCYIATAAYGSYLDPHVQVLRDFRDAYLLTNPVGKTLVKFYYQYSPPVANFISQHEALRTVVRWTLTPVVYGIMYPFVVFSSLIFLTGGLLLYRLRKVART